MNRWRGSLGRRGAGTGPQLLCSGGWKAGAPSLAEGCERSSSISRDICDEAGG